MIDETILKEIEFNIFEHFKRGKRLGVTYLSEVIGSAYGHLNPFDIDHCVYEVLDRLIAKGSVMRVGTYAYHLCNMKELWYCHRIGSHAFGEF